MGIIYSEVIIVGVTISGEDHAAVSSAASETATKNHNNAER